MLCYDMAATKGLQLSWYVEPELPPRLMVDSARLQQILINLLSNGQTREAVCEFGNWHKHPLSALRVLSLCAVLAAIKFTRVGGVELRVGGYPLAPHEWPGVRVRTPELSRHGLTGCGPAVRVQAPVSGTPAVSPAVLGGSLSPPTISGSGSAPERWLLVVSIKDSGIGISPDQLGCLFKSFSQVQHNTGEFGGTGLGLIISMRLCQKMYGEVVVQSELGKGSVFTFTLVAEVSTAPDAPQATVSHARTLSSEQRLQVLQLKARRPSIIEPLQPAQPLGVSELASALASIDVDAEVTPGIHTDTAIAAAAVAAGQSTTKSQRQEQQQQHPAPLSLHGLTSAERTRLAASSFLYIGELHAFAGNVLQLLRHFCASVHACDSVDEAAKWVQQRLEVRNQLEDAVSPPASDSAVAASSPEIPSPCSVVLVDLDSKGLSDDRVLESLAGVDSVAVFKLLFFYSARHQTALSAGKYICQGKKSPSVNVRSVGQRTTTTPHAAVSPAVPADGKAASASDVPVAASAASALSPALSAATLGVSAMRTLGLQKPFKMAQLLQALLQLLGEELTSSSLSDNNREEGTLIRRATSNGSPSPGASGNEQVSGNRFPSSASSSALGSSGRNKITPIASEYPLRILLAEDNLINQKMMVMLLRKLGYEIIVAANGHEVLQRLESEARRGKEFEVECILMDANMNIMDGQQERRKQQLRGRSILNAGTNALSFRSFVPCAGIECTRAIRAHQLPHRKRPFIIALTANVTGEYKATCLAAGMDLFSVSHTAALLLPTECHCQCAAVFHVLC